MGSKIPQIHRNLQYTPLRVQISFHKAIQDSKWQTSANGTSQQMAQASKWHKTANGTRYVMTAEQPMAAGRLTEDRRWQKTAKGTGQKMVHDGSHLPHTCGATWPLCPSHPECASVPASPCWPGTLCSACTKHD